MDWLTLSEVKTHLRVDHDLEDGLIAQMADAAEDYVAQYLGREVPWSDDESSEIVPASVRQAALMIVSDMYHNREAQGAAVHENEAVHNMLHFYRVGLGV